VPVLSPRYIDLLERDLELDVLAGAIRRAAGGAGGTVLVEGPAGVGKTRLLQAAAERAVDSSLMVLRARGGELERSFPFGIARQLFAAAVGALNAGRRDSVLSGTAGVAVELVDPRAPARIVFDSDEALYARVHGLYWLCAGLAAERPLVLVVDDAQWADLPSLQWLLFMARRPGDLPVTLVVSARTPGAGEWPEPLSLLRDEPGVVLIRPLPLTASGSAVLIDRMLGQGPAEEFAAACHRATGGNPFFLCELMASLRVDGIAPTAGAAAQVGSLAPGSIVRSVVVRLARLPADAATLARCIAVLGAEAEVRHAARLAELDMARAARAVDALTAAGFLGADRPLRLIHPVVRSAVYADLPSGERAQLHHRAARILAEEDGDVDAIAAHLLASEPAGESWTVDVLLRAADRALARGAPPAAATYLRRALIEPPPGERRPVVLHRLGAVESRLGDPAGAEHLDQAVRASGEPRQRVELASALSVGQVVAGRFEAAIRTLEHAIDDTPSDDHELRWRLQAQLINLARTNGADRDLADRYLEQVPPNLAGATAAERLLLAEVAFTELIAGEPVGRVAGLATRALGGGALIAEQPPGSLTVLNLVWALVFTDRHDLALDAYEKLITAAGEQGSPIAFSLICSRRSELHYLRGAIPDAIADARASIESGRDFGPSLIAPALYGPLIDALLEAGDLPAAEHALASSTAGREIPPIWQLFPLIRARARLRLAQGNTQAGIDDLLSGYELLTRVGLTNPAGTHCRSAAAVALASLGQTKQARKLVEDELAAARRFGAPSTVGISLRAAGVIEQGTARIDCLREAVANLKRSPARLEHARALADLGAAVRRSGQRREAQALLRDALDLADRCGATTVAKQARDELQITGARPRRARIAGPDALTASERRVAQMAAQQLTNRQIAQALFVSMHTVSTHLGHIYSKLGITDRTQLAAALSGEHPPAA
jgi:DNA-binding CsgD family transcriptional regulator